APWHIYSVCGFCRAAARATNPDLNDEQLPGAATLRLTAAINSLSDRGFIMSYKASLACAGAFAAAATLAGSAFAAEPAPAPPPPPPFTWTGIYLGGQ